MHLHACMSLAENVLQYLVGDESIRIDFRIDISLVISLKLIYLKFQLKIKLKQDGIGCWQYWKNTKTDNKRISVKLFCNWRKKKCYQETHHFWLDSTRRSCTWKSIAPRCLQRAPLWFLHLWACLLWHLPTCHALACGQWGKRGLEVHGNGTGRNSCAVLVCFL